MQNTKQFVKAGTAALSEILAQLPEAEVAGLEQIFATGSRLCLAVELDATADICVSLGVIDQSGERKTLCVINGQQPALNG